MVYVKGIIYQSGLMINKWAQRDANENSAESQPLP